MPETLECRAAWVHGRICRFGVSPPVPQNDAAGGATRPFIAEAVKWRSTSFP